MEKNTNGINTTTYAIIKDKDGWHGSNSTPGCLYGKALSEAIRDELGKFVEGISVSVEIFSVGVGQRLILECMVSKDDIVPFEDYEKFKMDCVDFTLFTGKLLHEGEISYKGKWVELDSLSESEKLMAYKECYAKRYESLAKFDANITIDVNELDEYADILAGTFLRKLKTIKTIVDSFNYTHSDAMSDYHDIGFYTKYILTKRKSVPQTS